MIFNRGLEIKDSLPVNQAFGGGTALVQDFLAPFVQVLKAGFTLNYDSIDDELDPEEIMLKSSLGRKAFYQDEPWWDFNLKIKQGGLVFLEGSYKNRKIELKWE